MFHLAAYKDGNLAASSVYASLPLIIGSQDWNQNNKFYPPEPMEIIWGMAWGADLESARVNTPSMRDIGPHEIFPFDINDPYLSKFNFDDIHEYPVRIKQLETVDVQTSTGAGGPSPVTCLLGLRVRADPKPVGPRRRCRFTAAITAVADQWTVGKISMETDLPMGRYVVIGMGVNSATGYAARLALQNEVWRPGVPILNTLGDAYPDGMMPQDWGGFGGFWQQTMPNLEILCTAADTAQTGFLDLVKVA